ncbi:EAL domain-containing protein [Lyngbya confervoides]|uniref:EAL domain-containing protein n=1 Tax=Lyngbya confervoides BDU141951 TaxID=1574623 RepID=A0ABD4T5S3_9CYAN|nr:EAL domain-containing protein [Lyngbya confervoides]MCM1983887.1 EAL domain-containing protein [Lyngbya confervoides BDU141951]
MIQPPVSDIVFRTLIQHSTDIITILDVNGIILYESPSVKDITGFTPDELENQSVFQFIHPGDLNAVIEDFQSVLKYPDKTHTSEFRFMTKSGDWCYLEVVGTNLLEDPNIQGIVINSRNISDRKAFERALAESEAKFRSLIEHSTDIILIVSKNGNIFYSNQSLNSILGYAENSLNSIKIQELIHPQDLDLFNENILNLNRHHGSSRITEIRLKSKKNSWNIFEITGINLIHDSSVSGILINARDVNQRKLDERKLQFLAWKDPLTTLFNRSFFSQSLENQFGIRKRDKSYIFALIFLDLDRFKLINDSWGHAAGDQLLQQVAQRLQQCVRPSDTIARFGGDEFALLLTNISKIEQVIQVAERISRILSQPFSLEGREVYTSASMGIALSTIDSQKNPEELLRDADTALYRAKENGRTRYEIFDAEMHQQAVNFLKMETELTRAIGSEQLEVHYQPIISISTGELRGMEALLRWKHPHQGLISPSFFIPIAEETGLINALSWWVLQTATKQLTRWHTLGEKYADLYVSINISARQFRRPELMTEILQSIQENHISPTHLCLEITESTLMQSPDNAATLFSRLKDIGIKIFMDDFGTGYSSLSYLQRFPVDAIKIDRSFISHIHQAGTGASSSSDTEIVRAIVTLVRNLGIYAIAEGIEQQNQLDLLKDIGCEFGQGFWFSKPLNADQTHEFICNYVFPSLGLESTHS